MPSARQREVSAGATVAFAPRSHDEMVYPGERERTSTALPAPIDATLGERELAEVMDSAAVGFDWVAPDGRILGANRTQLQLLGYERDEYVGHNISEFHPDKEASAEILAGLRRHGGLREYEARLRRKDGSVGHVLISSSARWDGDRFVHARCFTRDITERRLSERRLEAQYVVTRALAEADRLEDASRRLLPEVGRLLGWDVGALWTLDPAAGVLRCQDFWRDESARAEEFEGVTRSLALGPGAGLPGRVWATRQLVWVRDLRELDAVRRGVSAARAGLHAAFGFPVVNSREFYGVIEFFSRDVREPEAGLRELFEGVGAQIAQFIERTRAEEQLQAAVRARDEVLSSVAHDLRGPLTFIKGQAQLVQRRAAKVGVHPAFIDDVRRIDTAASNMAGLIEELVDISRLQMGQQLQLDRQPVDIVAMTRAVVADHERHADQHQIRIESAVPTLVGEWDPARLERVLGNLLSNAIKYSPADTEITVNVGRSQDAGRPWAVLEVEDRGLGIPAADLPHIFERFARGANVAGRIRGTGIGLTAARQVIELHGGTISVRSVEGHGSTFTVRLPLRPPQQ
jgi:PAS domain S-box-containing protein